jgi:hypothetical protein
LGELQNVRSLLTVGLLFCSEGQVQEEMKNLKIINRSGEEIQLVELVNTIQIGDIIPIPEGYEHNYRCNRDLDDKSIRLHLPHQQSVDLRPRIHLNGDFMDANQIAYVRKGYGDRWFVDPIPRQAKLVTKHVCNSNASEFALAEFVLGKVGQTKRVPGRTDHAPWNAWWEIPIPERTKNLLVVDPGNKDRKYFGRGGGQSLVGSNAELDELREQNKDMHEIDMASHFERVEVKKNSPGGSLELKYHRGLRFWFKLSL